MSHKIAILLSGFIWFSIGVLLLSKGIGFLITAGGVLDQSWLLKGLSTGFGSVEKASLLLISMALLLGFIKGRLILSKSVNRIVSRMYTFKEPIALKKVYPKSYFVLLGAMMGLGLCIKWIPISLDIRGFIDTTIGSALINGSILYFKEAFFPIRKNT